MLRRAVSEEGRKDPTISKAMISKAIPALWAYLTEEADVLPQGREGEIREEDSALGLL